MMNDQSKLPWASIAIAAVIVLATGIGLTAVLLMSPFGDEEKGTSRDFDYDIEKYHAIDPALIGYEQTAAIPLTITLPRAIAVDADDRIYVAGDRSVDVFSSDGTPAGRIDVGAEPRSMAVAGAEHTEPGRLYLGMGGHVEVFTPQGRRVATWASPGEYAQLTSIAVMGADVFVADASGKIVIRYDADGNELGRIGARDEARNIPGFVIPSPYFDVAAAPDGLLRVVNPGLHRIEAYTVEGDLETSWGRREFTIEGFCGCCNPANMAIGPDGHVITAEKGIPRVKVYDAMGHLLSVVVGPDVLLPHAPQAEETREEHRPGVVDVAVDSKHRVLVLDPMARQVRIFVATAPSS